MLMLEETKMKTDFGIYLKGKRLGKGFTINQLALYSGVSSAQLSRIENGKRGAPKPENLRNIANALSVPYKEMMKVAGYIDNGSTDDEEFEKWVSTPADERFFEEYNQAPEERRAALREMWEILKKQGKA